MKRLLGLISRRTRTPAAPFDAPLEPAEPLAVIGDVHGRDDLLGQLLEELGAEAPGFRLVQVGDVIDRGEASAGVLRRLAARPDVASLMGNHEAMCLEFLDDPERYGPRWLWNGGLQTLASFGVGGVTMGSRAETMRKARDRLAAAMGEDLVAWMRARPLTLQSGNVVVAHAGAHPLRPIAAQEDQDLLWGHPLFGREPRGDGLWIVHGHTILPEPLAEPGRIGVDTGAFATGRLTAALIAKGRVEFVST